MRADTITVCDGTCETNPWGKLNKRPAACGEAKLSGTRLSSEGEMLKVQIIADRFMAEKASVGGLEPRY